MPLETNHIRKLQRPLSECNDEGAWKRWSCTRLSSPVKWAKRVVWMNASGDRRQRRCSGLSDNFGKVKERVGVLIEVFVGFGAGNDEEGLKKWVVAIDSRREKKEGDEDDWFWTSSDGRCFEESEENGRGEAGCLTRIILVRIVLSAARNVPKSVKTKPIGVK